MHLTIDRDSLRPLVQAVVEEVLRQLDGQRQSLPEGRLAYSEQEAAALLGLQRHQLRDERLRGRVGSSVIVGGKLRYTRDDLMGYLARQRAEAITG